MLGRRYLDVAQLVAHPAWDRGVGSSNLSIQTMDESTMITNVAVPPWLWARVVNVEPEYPFAFVEAAILKALDECEGGQRDVACRRRRWWQRK